MPIFEEQEPHPHQNEQHQNETTPPTDHENTDTDATSTMAMPPQPHIQVSQLAWFLHDIMAQDLSFNAPILQALKSANSSSASAGPLQPAMLTRQGLAQLSAHLAIASNLMAQSNATATEILDDDNGM